MKNCPNCGLELPDGAIICTRCSHRFLRDTGYNGETDWAVKTPKKKKIPVKLILLSICGVAAVAGAAFVALKGVGGHDKKLEAIEQASQLLQEGKYTACESYTQQALETYQDDSVLLQTLGSAQVGLGDYEKAVQTYDQVGVTNLDTDALPDYIQAQIYGGSQQKVAQAFDRYMDENTEYDAPVLAQVAAASAKEEDLETMERSVSELSLMMENGLTDPDWNLETASQILENSMEPPAQPTLSVALPYYLGAASRLDPDQKVEQTLTNCYAAWRNTTADPLQSDWECYSLMNGAAGTFPMQTAIHAAYVDFLSQLSADLETITETLLDRNDRGTLNFGAQADPDCERKFTEAILNACAEQNGSVDRLSRMEQQMEQKNYRQVIQLWENDPWIQKHDLWYRDGVFQLSPLDGSGNYVHLSSSGVYIGQVEKGVEAGAGSMVMRGSDGHILYYVGVWADGVMSGTWIDFDEQTGTAQIVQSTTGQSSSSSTPSGSFSGSSSSAQTSEPEQAGSAELDLSVVPSVQDLQEMMRKAEEQSQWMLGEIQ